MALVLQHAVQALGLQAARVLVGGLAVAARNLGQVRNMDLHLPYHFVSLENEATENIRHICAILGSAAALWRDSQKFPRDEAENRMASPEGTEIPKSDVNSPLSSLCISSTS